MKIRKRIRPTTDPWGTSDKTGTGSEAWPSKTTCWLRPESHELIHLWMDLVSHSNRVCVIASCVGLCWRPLWNPWWSNLSSCAPDSSHHPGCWWYRAQTEPTGFHKTPDFGTHADSQQGGYLRLSACWCCSSIYAQGFCNRCRLATQVSYIGGFIVTYFRFYK